MSDVLLAAVEILFVLLFAWSVWRAVHDRSRLALDVALIFTPIAAVFVTQFIDDAIISVPQALSVGVILLLLAQPIASLRLVADIRIVPRWLLPVSSAIMVAVTAGLVLTVGAWPPLLLLAAVVLFAGGQLLAAVYLLDEARRRAGGARVRLILAAIGTAAVGMALFVSVAGAQAGVRDDVVALGWRLTALLAAACFWIAFLPPGPLRALWQATAAFNHTQRMLAKPPSTTAAEMWGDLAKAVHQLTGAGAVIVTAEPDAGLRVAAHAHAGLDSLEVFPDGSLSALLAGRGTDPVGAKLCERAGCEFAIVVPIERDRVPSGAVCLFRRRRSLFDSDDADLVALLAARSAALVQRREALAEHERLVQQLGRTVKALESASSAKSDFLASMSHELRTPLNAIIGFSELMAADGGDGEMLTVPREWVDHIRNGGTHLVSLINDVLDLAKVEAGRLELAREPVDIGHAVLESAGGLRPLAERKNQVLEIAGDTVTIDADPGRLRQILYNLLSNAIKYTEPGGHITIRTTPTPAGVEIAVSDTGVGIAPDDQERVFEEFQQVGDAAARVSGTGLGLALTKRLVEAHGGTIVLESTPGEGSTFTVTLPAGTPARDEPGPPVDGRPQGSANRTVLIIEDDPSSVRLLQQFLADGDYDVAVAPDGETGLRMAAADPPAAILLDILLPTIDGWDVLRRLKSTPIVRDVPVVIVTVVDERNVGLALGAVDYLVKPIERDVLLDRLDRHTFLARAREQPIDVLAIDDDRASLEMIEATLQPLGFDVRLAASGRQGLDLIDGRRPDLVICDLMMPEVDGFEVIGRLHENPATRSIPILVLTGHPLTPSDKARLNGRILGVVDKGEVAAAGLRHWLERVLPVAGGSNGNGAGASTPVRDG